jgi:hypothetical protein
VKWQSPLKTNPATPHQGPRHAAHRSGARAYMLGLSKDRELHTQWQRAAELLRAEADVGAVSRQLELALLYDGKLDVRAMA